MRFGAPPRSCERARQWASLRLDGELSEFEHVLLASHLEQCGDCADYSSSVTATTEQLRRAPLDRPTIPLGLPLRRRAERARLFGLSAAAAAAAAVVAVAVALGTLVGSVGGSTHTVRRGVPYAAVSSQPQGEQALIEEPKLAMLRAKAGIGKQRGIGIADV